jgi:uncharacterized membrane protein
MALVIPTVHLNGTSKAALIEQLEAAYDALVTAENTIRQAAPNGRDYYPQGSNVIYDAIEQNVARQQKVREVREEIATIIEAVEKQGR